VTTQISRAALDDLDELLPLVSAYRAFYEQEPDGARERACIERNLREGRSTIFVARAAGEAVGFVQLFETQSTVWLGPSLILEDLYVSPRARRAGVAMKLIERAMEFARSIGSVGMFLETARDNLAAQAVYERAAWRRESRFLKYNAPLDSR
jgi:ribosomal protein S18 acetylase RimI-like enzyme